MLTYKQAYDLLIDAYYKDEIKPFCREFCFCGTLNENNGDWFNEKLAKLQQTRRHNDGINYNGSELYSMERALLNAIGLIFPTNPRYEEKLFEGFCKALDVLKQIHIERGEVIDEVCELSKRVLVK